MQQRGTKKPKTLACNPEAFNYDFMALNEWKLLSSAGFVTFPHHDAGGLATYITMRTGMKIWGIFRLKADTQASSSDSPSASTQGRLLATDAILEMKDLKEHADLFILMLTPGAVLLVFLYWFR